MIGPAQSMGGQYGYEVKQKMAKDQHFDIPVFLIMKCKDEPDDERIDHLRPAAVGIMGEPEKQGRDDQCEPGILQEQL